ncbi:MAG: FecR domain-containing protein [Deltaproteobacteria bacterium]|nr:FecR domain-containing protein [Deltaproteobacteria bacterium]
MKTTDRNGIISEERLEELLLDVRPDHPDTPLHPRVDDLTRRRMVSAVLADWEDANLPHIGPRSHRRHITAIAVGTAVAAAVLVGVIAFFQTRPTSTQRQSIAAADLNQPTTDNTQLVPQSRFSLLQGEVNWGDSAVKLGASVPIGQWIETRHGQSAFALPTGIAVGIADNSSVRVFWNGKRRYEVEISQGTALFSINPQKSREGFHVRTPNGVVEVTGTLFSVSVADEGDVDVHLHRGKVTIRNARKNIAQVRAGQSAYLSRQGMKVVENDAPASVVTGQLFRLGCLDGGQTFSELTQSDCDATAKITGATVSADQVDDSRQPQNRAGNIRHNRGDTSSMADLLQAARQARKDENWSEAATIYRQLIRSYPQSANSRTALVSLAEIELKRLNKPQLALTHFNAYLASPGALEREALYGKAKAYRLTNSTANEIKTLRKLVSKYPIGPISQAAGKRLKELSDQ